MLYLVVLKNVLTMNYWLFKDRINHGRRLLQNYLLCWKATHKVAVLVRGIDDIDSHFLRMDY